MESQQASWTVIKLGGTSVSRAAWWDNVIIEIRQHLENGKRVLVVQSALTGVTDLLEQLLQEPLAESREEILNEIAARHSRLADEMAVEFTALDAWINRLRQQALGAALTGEVTPRLRAAVLASGELMASEIAAAYFAKLELPACRVDARDHLKSERRRMQQGGHAHFLSAGCSAEPGPAMQASFNALQPIVLTQGFIASDTEGQTVLLGRGGSDTSAACFAAQLQAERLEIWTDVPGMFSANPREVPSARLLKNLDYDEAQEIASTGAKVLHPRCIEPLRRHRIDLLIRYTPQPDMPHTAIGPAAAISSGRVKAISVRRDIRLVEMSTTGMWQQVGFLADAFALFKQHGYSIDLVSTSETTVIVSLDPLANSMDAASLKLLLDDLASVCTPRLISDCAAVSLVGRHMRANLHRLAPVLELFDERRVHLLSQAANDLNLTLVVDNADAARLVRQLHALMIRADEEDDVFGPTWETLFSDTERKQLPGAWWEDARESLLARAVHTPCYVYHRASLVAAAQRLQSLPVSKVFFAMKANNHPDVLREFHTLGLGFECVSPGEVQHLRELFPDIPAERLLFTPNFAAREDYEFALAHDIPVTLDNSFPLREWPEMFKGRDILLRIDPGKGDGHHRHVRTAGSHSKFGIPEFELDDVAGLAAAAGAGIIGLHAHSGSGVRDPELWLNVALKLAEIAERFPDVRILDLGGGFGVPERRGDAPLDTAALDQSLQEFRNAHPRFELWIEPGRYLVAEAGVLLTRVTQLKGKQGAHYVGVDAGMHSLIRPALYGAHHDIVNLSRFDEPAAITANVVGPICETGDVLGIERRLPECAEGDVMLIANAGAYGRVMSSEYNLRGLPEESLI